MNFVLDNKEYYLSSISNQRDWSYYERFFFLQRIFISLSYDKLFSIIKSLSNQDKLLMFSLISRHERCYRSKIKKICLLFAKGNIFYYDEFGSSDWYVKLFDISFAANKSDIAKITDPIIKFIVKYKV